MFLIPSGKEALLMADVEREIKSSLARPDARIVRQKGYLPGRLRFDYTDGKSKGTVLLDPLEVIDPEIVGGPGGIGRGETAVTLHIRLTETWYSGSPKACTKL